MIVCLDPGHHRSVKGKRSPHVPPGIVEWEFNLSVAMVVEDYLHVRGFDTFRTMALSSQINKTLRQRRNLAGNCECLVSIHANAARGAGWCGGSGFVVFHNPAGERLAECLATAYGEAIPEIRPRGRGYRLHPGLGILKVKKPAVLIECGFMTNREEAALLASPDIQKRIGQAIAAGIERGLK